jgi:hypothetical protein
MLGGALIGQRAWPAALAIAGAGIAGCARMFVASANALAAEGNP